VLIFEIYIFIGKIIFYKFLQVFFAEKISKTLKCLEYIKTNAPYIAGFSLLADQLQRKTAKKAGHISILGTVIFAGLRDCCANFSQQKLYICQEDNKEEL
jgi:hypothetical protein